MDLLTLRETVVEVEGFIDRRAPVQHCVVNAGKVVLIHKDPRLRAIVASCALVNADGQSVVWATRLLGTPAPERVTGIDLFLTLLRVAADRGYSVYFLGARESVVEAVVGRARREHSALRVAGWRNGYWDHGGDQAVVDAVRAAGPDILFVGISSPKKEYWLAEHLERLGVPFSMGVGGSFDVYAGRVKRAPALMQRCGLEWAYRFAQEPGRMWRRYLLGNVQFLMLVLRDWRERRSEAGAWPGGRD